MPYKPTLLLKPYFQNHLPLLREGLVIHQLRIDAIYKIRDWKNISLAIYKKNVATEGEDFEVGLYGHIELVNYLFGNTALLMVFASEFGEEETFNRVLELKKFIRERLRGGPSTQDIIVMMDLDQVPVTKSYLIKNRGVLCVEIGNQQRVQLSKKSGLWDYYFFKYVHAPNTFQKSRDEYEIFEQFDIFSPQNRLSMSDFERMMELKTYISPDDFIENASGK